MCGILGAIDFNGEGLIDKVSFGNKCLSHRGPDGKGIKSFKARDKCIVFAHSRLSIIDLSYLGHQPMSSADGRYWITFNGEIYNYKELREELVALGYEFVSHTDTEVLIYCWAEWGSHCIKRLNGMFAFVIYDVERKKIYCVRDAFGIKPIFFTHSEEKFYFSSEVPPLLTMMNKKLELNQQSVINYLIKGGYDIGKDTFLEEVNALEPGTYLTLDISDKFVLKKERWWRPSIVENSTISFNEAKDKLRCLFLESVRVHMRSDVPIGAALSGGIDSSSIVCAMRYLEPDMPIHTFSYLAQDAGLNEEKWVDIVNEHVNAIPHKIKLDSKELASDINDLTKAQGEPFGSTSIYAQYRVFKHAKESGVTVLLEGQGADELLAGYMGYPVHASMSYVDKNQYAKLIKFLKSWSKVTGRSIKPVLKSLSLEIVKHILIKTKLYRLRERYRKERVLTIPDWLLVDINSVKNTSKADNSSDEVFYGRRLVAELRRSVMGQYEMGLNSLLRHGDRNSMKWSVEGRVPFLTTEIAEFLLSLPEEYLLSKEGTTKYIFREAMRGIVPNEILDRSDKIGFATPEKEWISDINNDITDWVKNTSNIPFLDGIKIQEELKESLNGSKPFSWMTWRIINFCNWLVINKTHIETKLN